MLRVASLAYLTSRQLTPGKGIGCRLAVIKNQVCGSLLHQSAPSDCKHAMQQFISLLVSDWVLIYVLPMTATIVEGEWTKQGYMAQVVAGAQGDSPITTS